MPPERFGARDTLEVAGGAIGYYRLARLVDSGVARSLDRLPYSIRVLLEAALRRSGGTSGTITDRDVENLARWESHGPRMEIPFLPARVLLQDFTGVPV